jgi:hypothetical protein
MMRFVSAILFLVLALAVWWHIPMSTGGLSGAEPRPLALAGRDRRGCGVYRQTSITNTHFYRAPIDKATRQELHLEMVGAGYMHTKKQSERGLIESYRREAQGTISFLWIAPDGTVSAGAHRKKWPL